ncbi:hypothetical protein [Ascidiimonas sp. W6]|uniref:hypothetical protein n=1 Tax=Ascidiimonas meishanensis TaxID=3128903 RepID=UPI0030EBD373
MKTQNTTNSIARKEENDATHRSFKLLITETFRNVKCTMVRFNKNLSIYGAAAASAIRN